MIDHRPRRADGVLAHRSRLAGPTMDPAAVDAIASAIKVHEGFYPGSLASRNNNPGNLRFAGQPGAVASGGFASFSTLAQGEDALRNQIELDASRGTDAAGRPVLTVSDLIHSWAPPGENDTAAYVAAVTGATGYSPDASLLDLGAGLVPDSGGDSGGSGGSSVAGFIDVTAGGLSEVVIGAAAAGALWLAWRLFS